MQGLQLVGGNENGYPINFDMYQVSTTKISDFICIADNIGKYIEISFNLYNDGGTPEKFQHYLWFSVFIDTVPEVSYNSLLLKEGSVLQDRSDYISNFSYSYPYLIFSNSLFPKKNIYLIVYGRINGRYKGFKDIYSNKWIMDGYSQPSEVVKLEFNNIVLP